MYIINGYQTHPGLFTLEGGWKPPQACRLTQPCLFEVVRQDWHFAVGDRDRGLDCDVAKFVEVAQIENNKRRHHRPLASGTRLCPLLQSPDIGQLPHHKLQCNCPRRPAVAGCGFHRRLSVCFTARYHKN